MTSLIVESNKSESPSNNWTWPQKLERTTQTHNPLIVQTKAVHTMGQEKHPRSVSHLRTIRFTPPQRLLQLQEKDPKRLNDSTGYGSNIRWLPALNLVSPSLDDSSDLGAGSDVGHVHHD